jgi:membrane-associated protease RseP (regulator of RpoE activity)
MNQKQVKKKNNVQSVQKSAVKPKNADRKKIIRFVLIGLAILSFIMLIAALQKLPHLDFDDGHKHENK